MVQFLKMILNYFFKKLKLTQQAAADDCKYFVNHSEVKDMPCKQKDEF